MKIYASLCAAIFTITGALASATYAETGSRQVSQEEMDSIINSYEERMWSLLLQAQALEEELDALNEYIVELKEENLLLYQYICANKVNQLASDRSFSANIEEKCQYIESVDQ